MEGDTVRLDKWLWAARFFKTRSLAAEAIDGGKVNVNGERARRAKAVRTGDTVRVRIGPFEHIVVVRRISDRRTSASEARELYEETPDSIAARERLREQHRLLPAAFVPSQGRPTKKDRRALRKFRDR